MAVVVEVVVDGVSSLSNIYMYLSIYKLRSQQQCVSLFDLPKASTLHGSKRNLRHNGLNSPGIIDVIPTDVSLEGIPIELPLLVVFFRCVKESWL